MENGKGKGGRVSENRELSSEVIAKKKKIQESTDKSPQAPHKNNWEDERDRNGLRRSRGILRLNQLGLVTN